MKVFFVGTHSIVAQVDPTGNTVGARIIFETLGQSIDVPDYEATDWMRGGCALLTEDEWNSVAFTAEELKCYPNVGKQKYGPTDFQDKLKKAHALYSVKWQELRGLLPTPSAEDKDGKKDADPKKPVVVAVAPVDTKPLLTPVVSGTEGPLVDQPALPAKDLPPQPSEPILPVVAPEKPAA